jgi:hypothetical protein
MVLRREQRKETKRRKGESGLNIGSHGAFESALYKIQRVAPLINIVS